MDTASSASQPPRRRSSIWRILGRVVVVVSVLFTGGSALLAGVGAIFVQCWDEKTDLPSPDGRHIAHRRVHICEGPLVVNDTIRQALDIGRPGADGPARVYESNEYDIKMQWEDNDHLRIDIGSPETPRLSLHQGNGVHIAYHVPQRLMGLQSEDAQAQLHDEMHRTGKMSDADYAAAKIDNREFRLDDEMFIQWASENAIIDEGK